MNLNRPILSLKEYEPTSFEKYEISEENACLISDHYSKQICLDYPTPKTNHKYQLTSQGWVGYIPLSSNLVLELKPKVELSNLFRMIEYAYNLKSFMFIDGLIDCSSLEEFFEQLANVLSKRILNRGRRGFYRAYLAQIEQLPYARGRLNVQEAIRKPWDVNLHYQFEENTADIIENQILLWTLLKISRSGACSERVAPVVRNAFRSLKGFASVQPFSAKDCIKRLYNRLNDDYKTLHALCRFFLEQCGPSHVVGDKTFLPFLVNMNRLYELFVAEWLKIYLPDRFNLKIQEKVVIGESQDFSFLLDMVIYDIATSKPVCVLDTKYKASEKPSSEDITQAVAYAEMKYCNQAILVYPIRHKKELSEFIGSKRIRSLTFCLDGDLETNGKEFLKLLLMNLAYN